jgi:hypothetical protein
LLCLRQSPTWQTSVFLCFLLLKTTAFETFREPQSTQSLAEPGRASVPVRQRCGWSIQTQPRSAKSALPPSDDPARAGPPFTSTPTAHLHREPDRWRTAAVCVSRNVIGSVGMNIAKIGGHHWGQISLIDNWADASIQGCMAGRCASSTRGTLPPDSWRLKAEDIPDGGAAATMVCCKAVSGRCWWKTMPDGRKPDGQAHWNPVRVAKLGLSKEQQQAGRLGLSAAPTAAIVARIVWTLGKAAIGGVAELAGGIDYSAAGAEVSRIGKELSKFEI